MILGAADPANPYGTLLKWPARERGRARRARRDDGRATTPVRRGPTRTVGARVVLVDGALRRARLARRPADPDVAAGGRARALARRPRAVDDAGRRSRAAARAATAGCWSATSTACPRTSIRWRRSSSPPASCAPALGYQVRRERRPDLGAAAERRRTRADPQPRAMPEGDTIFRAARTLHRALAGHVVTRFDTAYAPLARVHDDTPITGRTIEARRGARQAPGDALLRRSRAAHAHAHARELAHLPARRALAAAAARRCASLVGTDDFVAVGFNVPGRGVRAARDVGARDAIARLGPDLLAPDFDAARGRAPPAGARRRCRSPRRCSISACWPASATSSSRRCCSRAASIRSTPVATLADDRLAALVDIARRQLAVNVRATRRPATAAAPPAASRRPKACGSTGAAAGRAGGAARRFRFAKQGFGARPTYWCPTCQTTVSRSPYAKRGAGSHRDSTSAPRPSLVSRPGLGPPASVDGDLDLARLRFLAGRQDHRQHAVLELRLDAVRVHRRRQRERAGEGAVGALDALIRVLLDLLTRASARRGWSGRCSRP